MYICSILIQLYNMSDIKVEKSEEFALRIVRLYQYLTIEKREIVMSKQLFRSGTSIGANIAEAVCAESNDDFIHKLAIAQKEASESKYWIRLLYKSGYLDESQYKSIGADCQSLLNIISAIIIKCKKAR